MKKTFKRLGAALLAMAMAVSVLCTGALAANTAQTGPFTITVKNETSGYTYAAYQVFKGNLATDDNNKKILSNIQWGEGVDSSKTDELLTAIKNITGTNSSKPFNDCTDAASIATTLSDSTKATADVVKEFAKVVGGYLSSNAQGTTNTLVTANTSTCTHTDGKDKDHYDISVNDAGYYLVKNTAVPDSTANTDTAYTNYILEVVGNVAVAPKTSTPSVTKKVNDKAEADTAQIGETVKFTLTGKLPDNYGDYKTYKYVFHDTLSEGLTYYTNTENASDEKNIKITIGGTDVTSSFTVTNNGQNLTITCDNLKDITSPVITADSEIVVTYYATLNEKATVGTNNPNTNKVYLEYSNDPNATGEGTTGKTPEDTVKVYTFKLNVTKVNSANQEDKLPNAKFVLATEKVTLGDINTDGVPENKTNLVAVTGTTPDFIVNPNPGTDASYVVSTDAQGTLNISGLKPGKYYLYETKAPEGYNRRTEPFEIVITATQTNETGEITDLSATVDSKNATVDLNTGTVDATIANDAGSQLPSTGGMGTTLFYIIGGVLMAGAAIVLVIKKKRSSAE